MVTVGIDPHKHVHVAVAVDAAGRQLGKPLAVKSGPHLITGLLTWARSLNDAASVTWAIEDGHGFARRLADGLLLAGQEVVWVPTRLMMAHRRLHAATGAKSDRSMPRQSPTLRSPPQSLIGTASTSQYGSCGCSWIIAPIWSGGAPWSSTSSRLSCTSGWITLLAIWCEPRPWPQWGHASPRHHCAHMFVRRCRTCSPEIAELNRRVRDHDALIKVLVTPLAPGLLQITGISHNSAAVLIAEIGDITRFSTSAKLARYAGCAPIPVYSSDKERHRLHRGGNRRLNSVLYTATIVQKRWDPAAKELLVRHEATKGARGARRILQRHLVDVIYRTMHADQTIWTHQITRCRPAA